MTREAVKKFFKEQLNVGCKQIGVHFVMRNPYFRNSISMVKLWERLSRFATLQIFRWKNTQCYFLKTFLIFLFCVKNILWNFCAIALTYSSLIKWNGNWLWDFKTPQTGCAFLPFHQWYVRSVSTQMKSRVWARISADISFLQNLIGRTNGQGVNLGLYFYVFLSKCHAKHDLSS